jgi:predicted metalloprotease with PDZ domain
VTPTVNDQGRVVMTSDMLNLEWNAVAFYPAGYFARQIMVEPSIKLPEGWQFGTALDTASSKDGTTTFKPANFDSLVDSPMFAGRNFKRVELDPNGPVRVSLNIVADRADLLDTKPEQIEAHRNLVAQAYKLYGAHHYAHYDFLLALTDTMGGIGLEHHKPARTAVPNYFTEWEDVDTRDLLPHNSPILEWQVPPSADLDGEFLVPMRDSLLWFMRPDTILGLCWRRSGSSPTAALDAIRRRQRP